MHLRPFLFKYFKFQLFAVVFSPQLILLNYEYKSLLFQSMLDIVSQEFLHWYYFLMLPSHQEYFPQ